MDFQQQPSGPLGQTPYPPMGQQPSPANNHAPQEMPQLNAFAVVSALFGVLAFFTLITIYLPSFFGSLAILFAILSKGNKARMHAAARSGIAASVAALIIAAALAAFALSTFLYDAQFRQEFNAIYENIYGESFDEQWNDILDFYK